MSKDKFQSTTDYSNPPPLTGEQHVPYPLVGGMKGTVTISPGVDLTEHTCPDWEAYAERTYGPDSRLGRMWAQLVEHQNPRRSAE